LVPLAIGIEGADEGLERAARRRVRECDVRHLAAQPALIAGDAAH
jgi:hypothetical protein